MHRRGLIGGAAAMAAAGMAGPALAARTKVGQPAPKYSVLTFDGRVFGPDELAGNVVLLNYWATWCAPCRAEMPVLDAYMRRNADKGLMMFAVATENSVPEKYLRPLAKALAFPLARSVRARGFGVLDAVPSSYVIGRDGTVRYAASGAFDAGELKAVLDPLLAEDRPAASVKEA